MSISTACPNGHSLDAQPHLAGRRVTCPKCGVEFVVSNIAPTSADDADDILTELPVDDELVDAGDAEFVDLIETDFGDGEFGDGEAVDLSTPNLSGDNWDLQTDLVMPVPTSTMPSSMVAAPRTAQPVSSTGGPPAFLGPLATMPVWLAGLYGIGVGLAFILLLGLVLFFLT